MKRLGSSDSLGALISICPSTEKKSPGSNHHGYGMGFQSMLDSFDEEDCMEESGHVAEKKRRLSVLQVKALEKIFEVENKLEPERKVKLAQELGLQPRQVAVWFQNRRARWKTKQLERDYGILHASYEDLKLKFDVLQHDKETLLAEVRGLKLKLQEENTESKISIKEEILISESEDKSTKISSTPNYESYNNDNGERNSVFLDFKDGFSDSDSSAILSEETSPNADDILISPPSSSFSFNFYSSSNCLPFPDSKFVSMNNQKGYQHQFVKTEEHNFFSLEEPCNFFSEEQAPTLQW